jgi:hypothetical protein
MGASWGRFTALVLAGFKFMRAPAAAPCRFPKTMLAVVVITVVGSALIGATAAAADTSVSQTSTFMYTGTNPCTAETFTGTGNLHFLESSSLSTDGSIHYDLQTRIDGLQAVTVTGKKYVVQDSFFDEFNFVGADEETFDITAHFIRVGEDGSFILGDDFYEKFQTHITTNDQGMITSFYVNTTDQPCQ